MTILRKYKKLLIVFASILVAGLSVLLILNGIVLGTTSAQIKDVTPDDGYQYALVLGAKVHQGGRLSDMLRDRMDKAIELYHAGAVQKLLLSGDGSSEWSEPEYMKRYAIENGVADEDILIDEKGFSTYESLANAKKRYLLTKLVIVTQKYHLHRALYIANDMDMAALGADGTYHVYAGQWYREAREILARLKDMTACLLN